MHIAVYILIILMINENVPQTLPPSKKKEKQQEEKIKQKKKY